jgi:hypothetical protein
LLPSIGFIDIDVFTAANSNCPRGLLDCYRFEGLDIVNVNRLEDLMRALEEGKGIAGYVSLD